MGGNAIPSSAVEPRLEAGGWRLEAGGWRLEAGGSLHLLQMTSADKSAPPDYSLLQCGAFVSPSDLHRNRSVQHSASSIRDPTWPSYHGAAERPEPPQQDGGKQEHQDEQSYGHNGPVRLEENSGSRAQKCTALLAVRWVYLGFIEVFHSHTVHSGAQLPCSAGLRRNKTFKQIICKTSEDLT
ncbi:hypothetical protein EYF80_046066 [Liparis tanakae]|uniref:Uncharacterized protein n=1 Tax=Liparis tanakae TaxID=230148 RepID=A0A4Z2FR78_9TELE|nr:hypothetical protein EYF80_046066 [Liparis tanakae]